METDWQAEFDALPEDIQRRVRHCALIFRVPLIAAFFRAKTLGLLNTSTDAETR